MKMNTEVVEVVEMLPYENGFLVSGFKDKEEVFKYWFKTKREALDWILANTTNDVALNI